MYCCRAIVLYSHTAQTVVQRKPYVEVPGAAVVSNTSKKSANPNCRLLYFVYRAESTAQDEYPTAVGTPIGVTLNIAFAWDKASECVILRADDLNCSHTPASILVRKPKDLAHVL